MGAVLGEKGESTLWVATQYLIFSIVDLKRLCCSNCRACGSGWERHVSVKNSPSQNKYAINFTTTPRKKRYSPVEGKMTGHLSHCCSHITQHRGSCYFFSEP